jgi:hypothetical protein
MMAICYQIATASRQGLRSSVIFITKCKGTHISIGF